MHRFPHGRRTVHDYLADPLPEGALERALAAANEAPCHKLTWPWRFTRVGPQARQVISALQLELKGARRALTDALRDKIRARTLNPAELLVVSQVRCDDPHRAREDYAAVACAIQNLCLSLHVDGVGSKWSTGAVTTHPQTYATLGIDPAAEEIVGFVWIGVPATQPPAVPRPPIQSLLRQTD